MRCPHCSQARFFKGERGLRVHYGKVHKARGVPSASQTVPTTSTATTLTPLWQQLSKLKHSVPILKRVPRGARPSVAKSLARCISLAARENSERAWEQLLTFPYRVLHVQKSLASKKTLTAQIKENCMSTISSFDPKLPARLPHKGLLHHVESKLGEGDISGAARVLFSSDVVAPYSPETFTALESKHPAAANDLSFPDPNDTDPLYITAIQLRSAVNSFRSGSAGGLDGLTPQHLKDLTSASAGEAGESLLRELTALINLMLAGNVHDAVIDVLYGANLCALRKKDGGIRPIAVGSIAPTDVS